MLNWTKHFDHIYCFHFLPDTERMPGFTNELRRVGILDSGIFSFVYTTPDPWEKKLMELCPNVAGRHASALQFLNLGLASARTIREALGLGYERVLFLEDDIRFLKDLDELETALAATPDGYDIVQYDKFMGWDVTPESYRAICEADAINEFYFDAQGKNDSKPKELSSGGCFMATKRGMENIHRALVEWRPVPMDGFLNMNGNRHAVARKNLAVQIVYGDAMLWSYLQREKANTHHKAYAPMALKYEDYAVPQGYGYDALCAKC